MKNIVAVFFILTIGSISLAQFHAELGFGISSGTATYKELFSNYSVTHDETALSFGAGVMGRIGIKLGNFSLTAVGFHDWEASSINFTSSNQSLLASGIYNLTHRRYGFGPSVLFFIPAVDFSLIAEYYPIVNNTIQWAEPKAQNPFRQNDWLSGWGWSAGIGRVFFKNVHVMAQYRQITFTKASLNGNEIAIPGSRFDKATWGGAFLGGSYLFF
ncbi:MAG: hypothetical protein IT289_12430 [Oligoflexia bacterium]|nr:hypothetical protein [Oligoflexia bacterium]